MNTNQDTDLTKEKLLENTIKLREKIKQQKGGGYKKLYIKLLLDIEKHLRTQPLRFDKIYQDAFGIGRIVTDGDQDSSMGKELLTYRGTLYRFCDSVKAKGSNMPPNVKTAK